MNLKHLTDQALLADTKAAAQREREALSRVLHHLREVDRRRLYSSLKYASINEYAIKELKYTEDQAWARVSAMKLLKEIPEIEPKINDGSLSLSNLSLARKAFSQEALRSKEESKPAVYRSVEQKIAVLEKIENTTKREAEKILRKETGVVVTAVESCRELDNGSYEFKIVVSKETRDAISRLKGLLAHSYPALTDGRLIELAVTELAVKNDPLLNTKKPRVSTVPERPKAERSNVRYIPATIRQKVWSRDGGRCTNCSSTHAVQYEHCVPVSFGGQSTLENLKLLCRSCNQRAAIKAYGVGKMSKYLRAPVLLYDSGRTRLAR